MLHPPASASQLLELQVSAATPGLNVAFCRMSSTKGHSHKLIEPGGTSRPDSKGLGCNVLAADLVSLSNGGHCPEFDLIS